MATRVTHQLASEELVKRRGRWPLLRKHLAAVANPAALFGTVGIVMRPVDEPTQLIPFVHPAHLHSVAYAKGNAFREIEVVGDQQCLSVTDINDEALMK